VDVGEEEFTLAVAVAVVAVLRRRLLRPQVCGAADASGLRRFLVAVARGHERLRSGGPESIQAVLCR